MSHDNADLPLEERREVFFSAPFERDPGKGVLYNDIFHALLADFVAQLGDPRHIDPVDVGEIDALCVLEFLFQDFYCFCSFGPGLH